MFCCTAFKSAILCQIACKFATIIVTTKVGAGLGLITAPFFGLVSSLPEKILSPALDKVANPGRNETAGAF